MGGGTDLDEAFQFLCDRAGGGDFLVLRATGDDDYNPYIQKLCPKLNSVATVILPNRAAAEDPVRRHSDPQGERGIYRRRRPGQLHQLLDEVAGRRTRCNRTSTAAFRWAEPAPALR